MANSVSRPVVLASALGLVGLLALPNAASAHVVYAHRAPLDGFFSPYDESYGTSPSFEIDPNPYGAGPAVRVVGRCQYPNGWNVTDFGRDVNGIPAGTEHTCSVPDLGGRVRPRY